MLAELIRELVGLGQKTVEVELHTTPELPRKVFLQHGQSLQEIDAPPPLRQHRLESFDDLVRALLDPAVCFAPEVYACSTKVAVLLDRSDRREVIEVALAESKRFALCGALQTPRALQPKEAVKMLRFDLHGGNVGHIIQQLSRVDFVRTSTGKSHVEHGRESLGRAVEASVQQADKVDDRFFLAVPVWSTAGFNRFGVQVEFGIYLDLENQAIELRVLPDEIERCRNLAVAALVSELRAQCPEVPVFTGRP